MYLEKVWKLLCQTVTGSCRPRWPAEQLFLSFNSGVWQCVICRAAILQSDVTGSQKSQKYWTFLQKTSTHLLKVLFNKQFFLERDDFKVVCVLGGDGQFEMSPSHSFFIIWVRSQISNHLDYYQSQWLANWNHCRNHSLKGCWIWVKRF